MTGSAPQSDGRCIAINNVEREEVWRRGGPPLDFARGLADFKNGVPVSTGSSFSRNKVSNFGFVFGTVSGIVRGVLFGVFWAPFGHHFGTP